MSTFSVAGGRRLRGRVAVPGDKSISHRALLLAALAEGTSRVRHLADGGDVSRSRAAIAQLGARLDGDRITGGRSALREAETVIDCGNSGTTMRLLAGLCAPFPWLTVMAGDRSLSRRPMGRVAEPLRAMGAFVDGRDGGNLPPLVVRGGGLHAIDYSPPVPSAQVKSAVLLAALGAEGETVIRERVQTRAHTEEMLEEYGAHITIEDGDGAGTVIRLRRSTLEPFDIDVPGDPSHAAFWVVAASIVPGSEVVIEDVDLSSGRTGFIDVLTRMGASIEVAHRSLRRGDIAVAATRLHGTDVGGDEVVGVIDEIPVLAVAAAAAEGETVFSGIGELRVKESDRIAALSSELSALGADVEAGPDFLVVHGGKPFQAAAVESHGDHRMAMALAVAALAGQGTTDIHGWEAVATSYPRFEEHLRACVS